VLYAPPASTVLPGTCLAVLDYYDSDRQLFKKGTIDLTNCIEVKLQPEIEVYKNVFSLRTKHRGRDRTYYLFSDNEEDMKHWVECLRAVLCLEGTCEFCCFFSITYFQTLC
jgi:PH domain